MIPYESKFIQTLRTRIAEDLTRIHTELGNGTQIVQNDAAATGMKCARYMGHIAGLEAALKLIAQVNDEMSGKGTDKKKDKD